MNYNFQLVVNNLSLGFVSLNILNELYFKGIAPNLFLISEPAELTGYNTPDDFNSYLSTCIAKSRKHYSRNDPSFRLWHISGSEGCIGKKSTLFTFYELDSPTEVEVNILNNHDNILVSCKETVDIFKNAGVTTNVVYCPLGFDKRRFFKTNKKYHEDGRIQFSLFGKFEKRKHHEKVIRTWIKKYGNNKAYSLNLHVFNPFFTPEQNNQILLGVFDGNKPFNVNCLPFTKTLAELNESYNVCDIVLDMAGGEGWSLPSFHTVGLGKIGVIHNVSAMKDWAENAGCVLIEPSGKESAVDNVFFKKDSSFNVGQIYSWSEDEFLAGCEQVIEKFKQNPINELGLKLQDKYTWAKTTDIILENL